MNDVLVRAWEVVGELLEAAMGANKSLELISEVNPLLELEPVLKVERLTEVGKLLTNMDEAVVVKTVTGADGVEVSMPEMLEKGGMKVVSELVMIWVVEVVVPVLVIASSEVVEEGEYDVVTLEESCAFDELEEATEGVSKNFSLVVLPGS